MAVLLSSTAVKTATSINSTSWSHTLASVPRAILVVAMSGEQSGDGGPTDGFSVTCGGAAMTKIVHRAGYRCWSAIYYILNPGTGAKTIVASPKCSPGVNDTFLGVSILLYNGLGSDTSSSDAGTATNDSLSLTVSKAGSYLIDSLVSRGTTAGSVGSGQTAIYNAVLASSNAHMVSRKAGVAGLNTMSFSGYANTNYSYSAVAIKPIASGGGFLMNFI